MSAFFDCFTRQRQDDITKTAQKSSSALVSEFFVRSLARQWGVECWLVLAESEQGGFQGLPKRAVCVEQSFFDNFSSFYGGGFKCFSLLLLLLRPHLLQILQQLGPVTTRSLKILTGIYLPKP